MIATAIVVGITLHAGNHLACDFPRVIAASPEEYSLVAGAFGADKPTYAGLLSGTEGITGVAMVVLMTVSFTLATHPFRKGEPKQGGASGNAVTSRLPAPLNRLTGFNAFWYSHHLLGIVYALLLVHGYFLFLVRRWYEKTVRASFFFLRIPYCGCDFYFGAFFHHAFRCIHCIARCVSCSLFPASERASARARARERERERGGSVATCSVAFWRVTAFLLFGPSRKGKGDCNPPVHDRDPFLRTRRCRGRGSLPLLLLYVAFFQKQRLVPISIIVIQRKRKRAKRGKNCATTPRTTSTAVGRRRAKGVGQAEFIE